MWDRTHNNGAQDVGGVLVVPGPTMVDLCNDDVDDRQLDHLEVEKEQQAGQEDVTEEISSSHVEVGVEVGEVK